MDSVKEVEEILAEFRISAKNQAAEKHRTFFALLFINLFIFKAFQFFSRGWPWLDFVLLICFNYFVVKQIGDGDLGVESIKPRLVSFYKNRVSHKIGKNKK